MKVIFLDIDGVLNSQDHVHKMNGLFDDPANQIDPDAVVRLNRLTDQSGAKIVVSSTWRISFVRHNNGDVVQGMADCLKGYGVTGEVIGTTPITNGDRSAEIWDWIDNHKDIEQYVILDDDRLEAKQDSSDPVLDLHFVKTSWMHGLLDHHVDRALEILKDKT